MTTTCPTCSNEIPSGQSSCGGCGAAAPVVVTTPPSADLAPPPPPAPDPVGATPTETAAERAVGGIGWALAGAGAAIVIGSFMPWATITVAFFSLTVNGTDGDGVITLFLGLGVGAVGALLAAGKGSRKLWIVGLILGGLAAAISIYHLGNITNISSEARDEGAHVSIGMGLWLCALASVAAVVIAVMIARRAKPAVEAPPP